MLNRREGHRAQWKLYTNKPSDSRGWDGKHLWNHIVFEHPASFRTLAMDPKKKKEIIDDFNCLLLKQRVLCKGCEV